MRSLLLPCLLVATAAAQEGGVRFLSIHDLVSPRPRPEPWLFLPTSPGSRLMLGEDQLLGASLGPDSEQVRPPEPAVISATELRNLLGHLNGNAAGELQLARGERMLVVPAGRGEAIATMLAALRQRLPPVVAGEVELTRTLGANRTTLLRRTFSGLASRTVVVSAVTATTAIGDFEVEIAQSAATSNPVMRAVHTGAMVALRPHLVPSGESAVVELLVRAVDPVVAAAIETGHGAMGPIDRMALATSSVGSVLRTHLGGSAVQRWQGPDGAELALTLKLQWQVPAPVQPGGQSVACLMLPPSQLGFRARSWDREFENDAERDLNTADRGGLEDLASMAQAGTQFEIPRGLVFAGDTAPRVAALANQLLDAMVAAPAFSLVVADVAVGAAIGGDGSLPADARVIGRCALAPLQDVWSSVQIYDEQNYVRDFDVEVAQASRIPDPKVERIASGLFLDLLCSGDRILVDGSYRRAGEMRRQRVSMSQEIGAPPTASGHGGGDRGPVSVTESPALRLPPDAGIIESPVIHRLPLTANGRLEAGKPLVLRSAAVGLGAERELVLIVQRAN